MLVFVLFAVINLAAGFACAVAFGYGPRPWYALFLPSGGESVVHIEVLETEAAPPTAENDTKEAAPAPEDEEEAEDPFEMEVKTAPPMEPPSTDQPFPEINDPDDEPEPAEVAVAEPPVEEPTLEEPHAPAASLAPEDNEHELEDYLAGRRDVEPEQKLPTSEPEEASPDDIAAMFAAGNGAKSAEPPQAAEPEDSEPEGTASDDDIEAMFASAKDLKSAKPASAAVEPEEEEEESADLALSQDDIASLFK